MRIDGRLLFPVILTLLCYAVTIGAEEDIPYTPPESEKVDWQVGVSIFESEISDPGLTSAAALIPRLVWDELAGVDQHKLTNPEKDYLARQALDKKLIESYSTLNTLYAGRDEYLFQVNKDLASLKDLEQKIAEENAAMIHWRDYPSHLVAVPDEIPVLYPASPEGGDLWELENISPESILRSTVLDVIISGSIVRVGDYYGIKISAFGPAGEEVLWEGAGGESDLEEISLEAGAAARRSVLGRPWASLTVQTEPPGALISINDFNAGVGFWSDSTLIPGEVTLEVTATGYAPKIISEVLVPNEITTLNVVLVETGTPQILIRTEPTGASIRLGSLWLGRAPLSVDLPDRVMSLTIEKDGFRTRTVPLYPESERLTIPLEYIVSDPAEELAKSRKKLNNSIAWFSFSLAPTIILLGVSQNYANMFLAAQEAGDYDAREKAFNAYNLSYGLMWGSITINLGLLTNVIFKLIKYLNAAEDLSS